MKMAAARSARETPRRTAGAIAADTASAATSRACQPLLADARDRLNARQPGAQRLFSNGRQLVGIATIVAVQCVDEASSFEPGDGRVQRAGAEPHIRERCDVFGNRVAVLGAVGEADEDQQG